MKLKNFHLLTKIGLDHIASGTVKRIAFKCFMPILSWEIVESEKLKSLGDLGVVSSFNSRFLVIMELKSNCHQMLVVVSAEKTSDLVRCSLA